MNTNELQDGKGAGFPLSDGLGRIAQLCVDDILEMSDAEIMAEAVEKYGSEAAAKEYAQKVKENILRSNFELDDKHDA